MRIPPKAVSMAVPDAGGKEGVAPLNKGLSPTGDWGVDRQDFCSRALQGRTGASVRFPAWKPKQ